MKLNEIGAPQGANKKTKRRGRGSGSGHGKNACRGRKGALKRSGRTTRPGFEGGQMPLIRRIPKRGFTAPFKNTYQVVNVESLNRFEKDAVVGPAEFKKAGFISSANLPVKILGTGALKKPLTIKAHRVSDSAKKLLQDAGVKIEFLEPQPEPKIQASVKKPAGPESKDKPVPAGKDAAPIAKDRPEPVKKPDDKGPRR